MLCCEYLTKTYIFHDYSELPISYVHTYVNSIHYHFSRQSVCHVSNFLLLIFSLSRSLEQKERFSTTPIFRVTLFPPLIFPIFIYVEIERKFEIKVGFLPFLIPNIFVFQFVKKKVKK